MSSSKPKRRTRRGYRPRRLPWTLLVVGVLSAWYVLPFQVAAQRTQEARPEGRPPGETHDLTLSVGENRTLSAQDVKSYSLGVPGVAEVRLTPDGKQFVVVGKSPGSTTLLGLYRDGREVLWKISVFARSMQSVEEELGALLGESLGIRVRRIGSRFFIEGGVGSEADLHRIEHIAGLYKGQVESLVVLGGAAADRDINVRVDVFFVQYEKSKLSQIGIDWPGRIGDPFVATNFTYDFLAGTTSQATASVVNHPLPGLDLAARVGYAKVLKHATVITANGSRATFQNGGAQNFSVTNALVASIQKIAFGTNIEILPRFDPVQRALEVNVNVEVADLTGATGDSELPGERTSTLTTLVSLKLGESLVLSGIRTMNAGETTRGVPWLSEIPILGPLFGTEAEESRELEGAIFVVPSIVDSIPADASELVQRALGDYDRFDGDLDEVEPTADLPASGNAPRSWRRAR